MRSAIDLEYGDAVRRGERVACPQCEVVTIWHTVPELEKHVRACRTIELGQLVGEVEMPPLDDLLPEVPKKPRGWGWVG
jgi:hypothetical protein